MRQYKDSGIEWIGKIPETWEVDIAKHVFKQRREKGNEVVCQLLAATQKYGMYPQNQLEGVVKVAVDTDLNQFKTVHKNDYVISLRSFQGGFEISDYEGVCSPAYQVFYATRPINSQYYKYLFKSDAFIQEINSLTVGIREGKNILYDDFVLLSIPIPSVLDQQQIASYLDKKCGEIDSLIALQEQMIEKLKAYKQSVITEAVTKGLDPNAKLVPSGIDWIGEIPSHWMILPHKQIMHKIKEINERYQGENIISLSMQGVIIRDLNGGGKMPTSFDGYQFVYPGNLLMCLFDIDVTPRCVGIIKDFGVTSPAYSQFVLHNKQAFAPYYYYLLLSIDDAKAITHLSKNLRSSLTAEDFGAIKTILPPLNEQKGIVSYLDEKCSDIDRLIALKQQKIESLKDYKKSVIYEAVTGKTEI